MAMKLCFFKKINFIVIIILIFFILGISCKMADTDTSPSIYIDKYNLNIRDIGPAGGHIFFINPNADAQGWKYLEVAPVETEFQNRWTSWQVFFKTINTAIGTGKINTEMIVARHNQLGETDNYVAKMCYYLNQYKQTGYNDWFLPSKDELSMIHKELMKYGIGSFDYTRFYFSSS